MQHQSRHIYDLFARAATSPVTAALMFVWAVAEAIVWPIIPDALLAPLAALQPRLAPKFLVLSASGSILGGAALYMFAFQQPQTATAWVHKLPFVQEWQVNHVADQLKTAGAWGFWNQPLSGIPFKVWGMIGGTVGLEPWHAIPIFAIARSLRMAVTAASSALVGSRFRSFLRDHAIFAAVAYLVIVGAGLTLTLVRR